MIFKTVRLAHELNIRKREEDKRAIIENIRKDALEDFLIRSYNNNVKLWAITAFTDTKKEINT
jgi:hypothetical protein